MDNKHILIIDDDVELSELIRDMLEDKGHTVDIINSVEESYTYLMNNMPHLILLDVNLPDGDGFAICSELRKISNVPVIFASARTSEDDRVTGLDMGGDDYIPKPYSIKELYSRINALLRRTYGISDREIIGIVAGEDNIIEIDTGARYMKKNGVRVELSPKEYDLFAFLLKNKGTAVDKDTLLNNVWGAFSVVEQSTLTVHIRWLREKLETNPSKPSLIKTVWGIGYMLEESGHE